MNIVLEVIFLIAFAYTAFTCFRDVKYMVKNMDIKKDKQTFSIYNNVLLAGLVWSVLAIQAIVNIVNLCK